MKISISLPLALAMQYAQAAQPTAFTQSRCLTAFTSKSAIVTTTTTAYTLTFRPPVLYTLTPSTIVTPAATTSMYSWLLNDTPHSMFYGWRRDPPVRGAGYEPSDKDSPRGLWSVLPSYRSLLYTCSAAFALIGSRLVSCNGREL